MEFHWRESVCICRCVTDSVCACVLYLSICASVSSAQLCCLYTHLLYEGELISQRVGFCSRSGLNTCYYRLSCCHPLHTAGPCPLSSLDLLLPRHRRQVRDLILYLFVSHTILRLLSCRLRNDCMLSPQPVEH